MARQSKLDNLYDADLPPISTSMIQDMLENHTFSTDEYRGGSRRMEASRSVPMMSVAFQKMLNSNGKVPTAAEYLEMYQASNSNFIESLNDGELRGVMHRVMRAYPSLVRDVHFVSLARELGAEAHRTLRDDIRGIDATIKTPDGDKYIRLYYDSPRSRQYRISKAMIHSISKDHIDVPLTKGNAIEFGKIYLYSPDFVSGLLRDVGAVVASVDTGRIEYE